MIYDVRYWGFMLITWVVANALTWIFGFELDTKEKILMPQIIIVCLVFISIGLYLMGV